MYFCFAAAKEIHKRVPVLKHKAAPFIRFMLQLKYEISGKLKLCVMFPLGKYMAAKEAATGIGVDMVWYIFAKSRCGDASEIHTVREDRREKENKREESP